MNQKLFCGIYLTLSFVVSSLLITPKSFAQKASDNRVVRHLSLAVGIIEDESLKNIPRGFTKSGTYKKVVRLRYNARAKILRFDPRKPGLGTLILKHPKTGKVLYEYRISVKKTNLYQVAREIQSLLGDIEGIKVKIINNRVVVDGQILLPKDMSRIHSVVKQYGSLASTIVTLSPIAQSKIAQFIERAINNPEIQVRAVNGKFLLEGVAGSNKEKTRAVILAKTFVPDVVVDEAVADKKVLQRKVDVVIDLITVRPPPPGGPRKIVQLVIHFVELSKNYTKGFRFQWTPDLGDGSELSFSTGQDSPGGVATTITGTVRNLLPKLNWAKEYGHARVLQNTSLIVEDGRQGVLNSTSRIPYQTVGSDGLQQTAFEETGIRTSVTPRILGARSDSVNLDINFAVKALVDQTAAGPLTSSREIKTIIVVRSGQSAAVGGLITNDTGTGYNRLPANASNNPLISLYASKDFRRSQSQFIVFITPIIKSSASSGVEKIKRKFRLKY